MVGCVMYFEVANETRKPLGYVVDSNGQYFAPNPRTNSGSDLGPWNCNRWKTARRASHVYTMSLEIYPANISQFTNNLNSSLLNIAVHEHFSANENGKAKYS